MHALHQQNQNTPGAAALMNLPQPSVTCFTRHSQQERSVLDLLLTLGMGPDYQQAGLQQMAPLCRDIHEFSASMQPEG